MTPREYGRRRYTKERLNPSVVVKMSHPFNDTELIAIFEIARLALTDVEVFDAAAHLLDLSDDAMQGFRDKLESFMAMGAE